jgi:DNA helicase-2/ATP-dependent DNA helicase PcrA
VITFDLFIQAMRTAIGREPNAGQRKAVEAAKSAALFVVAGPGTGKTATMTMRMLKLVFVDGLEPRSILATTFTNKAAEELRSRLLSWGYAIQEQLAKEKISKLDKIWLDRLDVNQIRTGTIDSICEEVLRDHRDPGTDPPILADQFVSETLLLRAGLFQSQRFRDNDLDGFLCDTRGTGTFGWNIGAKNGLVRTIWDRRHHDQLKWSKFAKSGSTPRDTTAIGLLDAALTDYAKELSDRLMVDFAQLEQTVLSRLQGGGLLDFTNELKVILVDEYQDTNLLQESLYFELAKRCNGAICVVGDDDQSMYRFRGATVDLFRDFEARYLSEVGKKPKKIFLNENYRSSQTIIDFVNAYATFDAGYQAARVAGKPPLINPAPKPKDVPILGMFRNNMDDLARDLAKFIHDVTKGSGFKIAGHTIKVASKVGDVGDLALLCSSPQEYGGGNDPKARLPKRLRDQLLALNPAIETFNPRGQEFAEIEAVQRLGGLLLECLDPGAGIQQVTSGLSDSIKATFDAWRTEAIDWVTNSPSLHALEKFAIKWSDRDPGRPGYSWPFNTPCLDLLYAIMHWMPELHDDPEGQVYLEVFTRQLGAAEQVSNFKARVVSDPSNQALSDKSVGHLLLYFLAPIAAGSAKVDEELIESFPRDRLNILSIHQSKGLEFPLTIVDVGSDFQTNAHGHRFKRHPKQPGPTQNLEDLMRPHSPLKTLNRSGVDRAFDDLFRQFFVAFSRPQDVLLLVGHTATRPGGNAINVATGCDRNEVHHWVGANQPYVDI